MSKTPLEIIEGQVEATNRKLTKLRRSLETKVGGPEYRKLVKKMTRTRERMERDQRSLSMMEEEMESLVESLKPVTVDTEAVEAEIQKLEELRNQYEKAAMVLKKH